MVTDAVNSTGTPNTIRSVAIRERPVKDYYSRLSGGGHSRDHAVPNCKKRSREKVIVVLPDRKINALSLFREAEAYKVENKIACKTQLHGSAKKIAVTRCLRQKCVMLR